MSAVVDSTRLSVDVAVVGGGVAGSSVAAVLAQSGMSVVLIERETRFRDRVRGESIHPWGVREVRALGLSDVLRSAGAHELPLWDGYANRASVVGGRYESLGPDVPNELAVYHPALQSALLDHARGCGVRILRPARVTAFSPGSLPRLLVETDDGRYEVYTRLVIGADGRQSAARRWLGARTVREPVHHQVGGCLLDGVSLADDTFATAGLDGGTVLIFPQGGGRVRSYVVGNDDLVAPIRGREHVAEYIACCASVFPEGSFGEARAIGPLAFFPNADVWSDRLYGDGVVLIGDAAGANDPSGGHGLSLCFRDVRQIRDRLTSAADWDAALRDYEAQRSTYYGVLRTFMQWLAILFTEVGPEAAARRERVGRAREADPTGGGFARMDISGPDGLIVDEAARRHYFGKDLEDIVEPIAEPPTADTPI